MIESIIDALNPEEVEFLRNTRFGRIISRAWVHRCDSAHILGCCST
ncbi:unnamed protein product [Brassica oleracea var. botrytis]